MKLRQIIKSAIFSLLVSFVASGQTPDSTRVIGAKRTKSVLDAYLLSLGTPLVLAGVGTMMGDEVGFFVSSIGVIVGPSAGHFYTHEWGRGILFSSIRCGAAYIFLSNIMVFGGEPNETAIKIAIGSFVCATIIDLALIPESVQKYNQRHNLQLKSNLNIKDKCCTLALTCYF